MLRRGLARAAGARRRGGRCSRCWRRRSALAARSDVVLAALVALTALGIAPAQLMTLTERPRALGALVVGPFLVLVALAVAHQPRVLRRDARGRPRARRLIYRSRGGRPGRALGGQRRAGARRPRRVS